MSRIHVCASAELVPGTVLVVPLGRDDEGYTREALVLRDQGGTVRAYLNLCKHLPIPLDGGSRRFLGRDGRHLECGTHGATYRIEDGLCVAGPCEGARLDAIRVEETAEGIFLQPRSAGSDQK
ncbi:MAG: Rieske (2Fe-2S) protein [Myxococcota bacterium]